MSKLNRLSQKGWIAVILMIVLVAVSLSLGGCSESYDSHVKTLREGSLYTRPNVKIGPAFDQFFPDGEWKYYDSSKTTNKSEIVQFKGTLMWEGKKAKMTMEFILHKDQSFEVGHVDINGVSMNQLVTQAILEKVLDSYKKK